RVGEALQRLMADHAQHLRDLGVVGADVALDERVVVLERAQGSVLGHVGTLDVGGPWPAARQAVGCPSVLLPESSKRGGGMRFMPLRRRSEPVSPECPHPAVWGPARLRALRLRQRAWARFSHRGVAAPGL